MSVSPPRETAETGRTRPPAYPSNVPRDIGPLRHASLAALIDHACKEFAERPAFTCMGKTIDYAELDRLSAAFAGWLESLDLESGARVAVMMPNVLQYPVVVAGILRAGLVVVNVNPLYKPRELEHQLADCGAEAIVVLENFAHTVESVVERTKVKHVCVAAMGDLLGAKGIAVNFVVRWIKRMVPAWSLPGHVSFRTAISGKRRHIPADIDSGALAFLQYTGGTTGVAKGAMLTHANVVSNVEQNGLWLQSAYLAHEKPDRVTYLCALPLYHIFALTVNMLMGIEQGAHNLLIVNPRDIPALVGEMRRTPVHIFPGLNTLFNALLNDEGFAKCDFTNLFLTLGGGMAVQRSVAERWKATTGCTIAEGYGLSETSPVISANRFDVEDYTGTIGLPLPSTDLDIRDDAGNRLETGEVGEICVRGPQVMKGYWNQPEETEAAMTDDGFFRTGDMGSTDKDGFTTIVDRKKDMILVSGFNVYPGEIEAVVCAHPGVAEAAAVGVEDAHSGEVVKLFVVRRDPALKEADIDKLCARELTNYKQPKHIAFRDSLPKSNVGKILRRELRDA